MPTWLLVTIIIVAVVGYLWFRYITMFAVHTPLVDLSFFCADTNSELTEILQGNQEYRKRQRRADKLQNLKRDLEHAQQLMELEERAQALRADYRQRQRSGTRYSSEVETALRTVVEDIDELKQT